jgi:hypothetical protein
VTTSRRADVFFYGLFMDPDLLRAKGLSPEGIEVARVDGLTLRIGRRAALVPSESAAVYGVIMSIELGDLQRLYSEPGLESYRPEAVLARLASGGLIAALCYNLPEPPSPSDRNPEYVEKLRSVARRVGLPAEYIEALA